MYWRWGVDSVEMCVQIQQKSAANVGDDGTHNRSRIEHSYRRAQTNSRHNVFIQRTSTGQTWQNLNYISHIFYSLRLFYYTTLNLRRPSFSSRRCTDLEQSSAAYHICSVTSSLLFSLEDILLRTLLVVITVSCLRSDTVIYGHVNRSYLLTYLLT